MSETASGLPAQSGQPSGIAEPTGQTQQQPPNPATPQPAPSPAAPATPSPEIAKLQQELDQYKNSARHFQSEKDRLAAQLQAVTGATPKADPLADDVKYFTAQGYEEKDARHLAGFINQKLQPLQQQNQQLQSALHGQSQVQRVMEEAAAKEPGLFNDPAIYRATYESLNQIAMSGDSRYMNPDYAINFGAGEWSVRNKPWAQQQQAPPPQQFRPAGSMSFAGPQGGYVPHQPPQQLSDPAVDAMTLRMAQRAGINPADLSK